MIRGTGNLQGSSLHFKVPATVIISLTILALLNMVGHGAYGAELTITNGAWHTASNWQPEQRVPNAGDTVVVAANGVVSLTFTPSTVAGLTVLGGAVLSHSSTLTVTGELVVEAAATIVTTNTLLFNIATISGAVNCSNSCTIRGSNAASEMNVYGAIRFGVNNAVISSSITDCIVNVYGEFEHRALSNTYIQLTYNTIMMPILHLHPGSIANVYNHLLPNQNAIMFHSGGFGTNVPKLVIGTTLNIHVLNCPGLVRYDVFIHNYNTIQIIRPTDCQFASSYTSVSFNRAITNMGTIMASEDFGGSAWWFELLQSSSNSTLELGQNVTSLTLNGATSVEGTFNRANNKVASLTARTSLVQWAASDFNIPLISITLGGSLRLFPCTGEISSMPEAAESSQFSCYSSVSTLNLNSGNILLYPALSSQLNPDLIQLFGTSSQLLINGSISLDSDFFANAGSIFSINANTIQSRIDFYGDVTMSLTAGNFEFRSVATYYHSSYTLTYNLGYYIFLSGSLLDSEITFMPTCVSNFFASSLASTNSIIFSGSNSMGITNHGILNVFLGACPAYWRINCQVINFGSIFIAKDDRVLNACADFNMIVGRMFNYNLLQFNSSTNFDTRLAQMRFEGGFTQGDAGITAGLVETVNILGAFPAFLNGSLFGGVASELNHLVFSLSFSNPAHFKPTSMHISNIHFSNGIVTLLPCNIPLAETADEEFFCYASVQQVILGGSGQFRLPAAALTQLQPDFTMTSGTLVLLGTETTRNDDVDTTIFPFHGVFVMNGGTIRTVSGTPRATIHFLNTFTTGDLISSKGVTFSNVIVRTFAEVVWYAYEAQSVDIYLTADPFHPEFIIEPESTFNYFSPSSAVSSIWMIFTGNLNYGLTNKGTLNVNIRNCQNLDFRLVARIINEGSIVFRNTTTCNSYLPPSSTSSINFYYPLVLPTNDSYVGVAPGHFPQGFATIQFHSIQQTNKNSVLLENVKTNQVIIQGATSSIQGRFSVETTTIRFFNVLDFNAMPGFQFDNFIIQNTVSLGPCGYEGSNPALISYACYSNISSFTTSNNAVVTFPSALLTQGQPNLYLNSGTTTFSGNATLTSAFHLSGGVIRCLSTEAPYPCSLTLLSFDNEISTAVSIAWYDVQINVAHQLFWIWRSSISFLVSTTGRATPKITILAGAVANIQMQTSTTYIFTSLGSDTMLFYNEGMVNVNFTACSGTGSVFDMNGGMLNTGEVNFDYRAGISDVTPCTGNVAPGNAGTMRWRHTFHNFGTINVNPVRLVGAYFSSGRSFFHGQSAEIHGIFSLMELSATGAQPDQLFGIFATNVETLTTTGPVVFMAETFPVKQLVISGQAILGPCGPAYFDVIVPFRDLSSSAFTCYADSLVEIRVISFGRLNIHAAQSPHIQPHTIIIQPSGGLSLDGSVNFHGDVFIAHRIEAQADVPSSVVNFYGSVTIDGPLQVWNTIANFHGNVTMRTGTNRPSLESYTNRLAVALIFHSTSNVIVHSDHPFNWQMFGGQSLTNHGNLTVNFTTCTGNMFINAPVVNFGNINVLNGAGTGCPVAQATIRFLLAVENYGTIWADPQTVLANSLQFSNRYTTLSTSKLIANANIVTIQGNSASLMQGTASLGEQATLSVHSVMTIQNILAFQAIAVQMDAFGGALSFGSCLNPETGAAYPNPLSSEAYSCYSMLKQLNVLNGYLNYPMQMGLVLTDVEVVIGSLISNGVLNVNNGQEVVIPGDLIFISGSLIGTSTISKSKITVLGEIQVKATPFKYLNGVTLVANSSMSWEVNNSHRLNHQFSGSNDARIVVSPQSSMKLVPILPLTYPRTFKLSYSSVNNPLAASVDIQGQLVIELPDNSTVVSGAPVYNNGFVTFSPTTVNPGEVVVHNITFGACASLGCSCPTATTLCTPRSLISCQACSKICNANEFTFASDCVSECPDGLVVSNSACVAVCPAGTAASNGFCVQSCPIGTFNSSLSVCVPCSAECSSCTSLEHCQSCQSSFLLENEQCVEVCSFGHFEHDGVCLNTCPEGKFSAGETCLDSCSESDGYPYADGNVCVAVCPQGTFANESDGPSTCEPCHSQCSQCFGPSLFDCTDCASDLFLMHSECVESCPESYFRLNSTYSQVDECVAFCPLPFVNELIDRVCLEACPPDAFLRKVFLPLPVRRRRDGGEIAVLEYHVCVQECSFGEFVYDNECLLECPEGTYHGSDEQDYNCYSTCPPGQFVDLINGTCVEVCSPNQFVADGKYCVSTCEGYGLAFESTCVWTCPLSHPYVVDGLRCESNCPTGFLPVLESSECVLTCPDGSQEYFSSIANETFCAFSCPSFFTQLEGTCVEFCPSQYYAVMGDEDESSACYPCDPACSECFGGLEFTCITCAEGYLRYLQTSYCVATCPPGTFPSEGSCLETCPPDTYQIDLNEGGKDCVEVCPEGYFIWFNICFPESCPEGSFKIEGTNICASCGVEHCLSCSSEQNCTLCEEGLVASSLGCTSACHALVPYTRDGLCVESCGERLMHEWECVIACPHGTFQIGNFCQESCPPAYIGNVLTGMCEPCHETCATCFGTGITQCLTCPFGVPLHDGMCSQVCSAGQFNFYGQCVNQCPAYFYALMETMTCEEFCPEFYFAFGQLCVTHCPLGSYADHDMRLCKSCAVANCATCAGGTATCSACLPSFYLLNNNQCVSTCNSPFVIDRDGNCIAQCPMQAFQGISWPISNPNTNVARPCQYGFSGNVFRFCNASGAWENVINSSECINVASAIENIDRVLTPQNAEEVLQKLGDLLETDPFRWEMSLGTLEAIADVLSGIENLSTLTGSNWSTLPIKILSNVLFQSLSSGSNSVIAEWQTQARESDSNFANLLDKAVFMMMTTKPSDFYDENTKTALFPASYVNALARNVSIDSVMSDLIIGEDENFPTIGAKIPTSLFEELRQLFGLESFIIQFATYSSDAFFPRTQNDDSEQASSSYVGSNVLSFLVAGAELKGMKSNITFDFTHDQGKSGFSPQCAYWDFNSLSWLSDGCTSIPLSPTSTRCVCNHTTNFAILFSLNLSASDAAALEAITYVGCALSLAGTFITFITFMMFKKLRTPAIRLVMNLCIALFFVNLVFIAGVIPTDDTTLEGCRAAGVFMHYFLLAAFAWMLVIVFSLVRALVFLDSNTSMYFKHMLLGCWCIPAIFVFITMAVDIDNYGGTTSCWFNRRNALIGGFVFWALLIIAINFVCFVMIVRALMRSSKERSKTLKQENRSQARAVFTIFVLMGLTWIFGILAMEDATLTLEYLFVIFNSLQGALICVLYCFNARVYAAYKSLASSTYSRFTTTSTRSTSYQTTNNNNNNNNNNTNNTNTNSASSSNSSRATTATINSSSSGTVSGRPSSMDTVASRYSSGADTIGRNSRIPASSVFSSSSSSTADGSNVHSSYYYDSNTSHFEEGEEDSVDLPVIISTTQDLEESMFGRSYEDALHKFMTLEMVDLSSKKHRIDFEEEEEERETRL